MFSLSHSTSNRGNSQLIPRRGSMCTVFKQILSMPNAGKMPHKTRKLVLCGPKVDSGKTSWVQVLLGVIPTRNVATITQEK